MKVENGVYEFKLKSKDQLLKKIIFLIRGKLFVENLTETEIEIINHALDLLEHELQLDGEIK